MSFYRMSADECAPDTCRGGVFTIGNFDGVHLGHGALLSHAKKQAQTLGAAAVAVTFDPHPLLLLRPQQFRPILTTMPERSRLLEENGADHVLILETNTQLLGLSAGEFFQKV